MDQPCSEKAYNLYVRRLYWLFIFNFRGLRRTISLTFNVVFSTMRIDNGFCKQAVFARGLADFQFGSFFYSWQITNAFYFLNTSI